MISVWEDGLVHTVMGCFSFVISVWEDGLVHTVIMDAMLGCVGVVWGYVGVSISVSMGFFEPLVGAVQKTLSTFSIWVIDYRKVLIHSCSSTSYSASSRNGL